jgi:predicted regulator of Ras-like GTPase activity (Roadblock/LC7/MglB family)
MNDNNLKVELDRIVNDLNQVEGVDGGLVVDGNGDILSQRILQNVDIGLFGPMAHVITSSSKRLLNSSNQGSIHRVLVESEKGKALFLHLGNVHFIVLMKDNANVGLIMVSSKRAAEKIVDLTKDLKTVLEDIKAEEVHEPDVLDENLLELTDENETQKITVISEDISKEESRLEVKEQALPTSDSEEEELKVGQEISDISDVEIEQVNEGVPSDEHTINEKLDSPIKSETIIPIIKPPIAFPAIKKVIDIPDNVEERADIILDIYEAIFRAMSIGASKIMGVAPARGLTQKFLPSEHCKKLLDGVGVKSNSTIDFNKIRENANKIAVENRETQFIEDFSKIIEVITENYGKVMGYGAFRGMVRPEFKLITDSYGPVMVKLGITEKMHPEMAELFE